MASTLVGGQHGLEVEWISDVLEEKQTRQETMGRQRQRCEGGEVKGSAKLAQVSGTEHSSREPPVNPPP